MINNKFLRIAMLTLAFVMLLSFNAFAEETNVNENTTLTFGIFSDVHNNATAMANVMNNFEALAGGNENIDGIAMVGDIAYLSSTQTPDASTYDVVNQNEDALYFKNEGKLVYAMGNHEFPEGSGANAEKSALSRSVFETQMGRAPESCYELDGYYFITAGPNTYNGELIEEQEKYVEDKITEALNKDENKPIFVFIHHPIDGTLYGSASDRHSDEFVEFLKAQPQVIVFSGHNHYPTSDPRSIRQYNGGATFIYSSSVTSGNPLNNPFTQRHDKAYPSQAYLMNIDSTTNVVTLKRFYVDASNPTYITDEDWVLDIPAMVAESKKADEEIDPSVYKYTYDGREAISVAPEYESDAAIEITALSSDSVSISFDEAVPGDAGENNMVGYYKIDIINNDTQEIVTTKKIISDYFLKESERRHSFECSFDGLTYDTFYTVSVTPLNMWYVEGESITHMFKTLGLPAGMGKISGYDESYYAAPATINDDGSGMKIDTAKAFQITEENNVRLAGIYAVSNDNFATKTLIYVYGLAAERKDIYEKDSGSFKRVSGNTTGTFVPGNFTSITQPLTPVSKDLYSYSQWTYKEINAYLGETDADKKAELLEELKEKYKDIYVSYALTDREIIPVSDVSSLEFGFRFQRSGIKDTTTLKIENGAYKFVAYVMDKNGAVTPHATIKTGITIQIGTHAYATIDFKNDTWAPAFPAESYLVGYRIYPYYGTPETTMTISGDGKDEAGTIRFIATPSTYTISIPKADAPKGITVDGTTFKGLDESTTYSIAPYSVLGADNTKAVEIKGVTSYTLPEGVGLYGIYIKGDGNNVQNSDAYIIYLRGSDANRQNLHDRNASGYYIMKEEGTSNANSSMNSTPKPGEFNCGGYWSSNLAKDKIGTGDKHVMTKNITPLYTAYTETYDDDEEAEKAKKAAFDTFIASKTNSVTLANTYLQYSMNADEIIPISEVVEYSYKVSKQEGSFTYKNQVSEFVALVMDEYGIIKEYTYQHVASKLGTTVTKTVDFQNKESTSGKWTDTLPTEGYLVGFKFMIYAGINDYRNVEIITNQNGVASGQVKFYVHPATEYVIKTKAPTSPAITVSPEANTLTVTNYDPSLAYAYSEDNGKTWTRFSGDVIELRKANTYYKVKTLENNSYYEGEAITADTATSAIAFKGASLVLGGKIGLKFYFDVDAAAKDNTQITLDLLKGEEIISDETYFFKGDSSNVEYSDDNRTACITVYVAPKDYKNLSVKFKDALVYTTNSDYADITAAFDGSFSVALYIELFSEQAEAGNADCIEAEGLVNALEAYCANAENYFDEDAEALDEVEADTDKINAIAAPTKGGTGIDGLSVYATSLVLRETVTIRHYFKWTEGADLTGLTASVDNGGKVNFSLDNKNGSYLFVDIDDIPAHKLDTAFTLTLTLGDKNINVTYSAMNYVKQCAADSGKSLNLSRALYNYCQEAIAYKAN